MTFKLLKFESDWCDEFIVSGYKIVTEEWWDEKLVEINRHFMEHSSYDEYFGTNEGWVWSSATELLSLIEVTNITTQVAQTIIKNIGREFGYFPYLEFDF